ncbi:aldehyde dehydrogenase [Vogesella sp. LIG4]|uniref:aldehyde dehydrogenase n=1 Tax=Vogesella sp. LIG4 TaxID=1192162 RepID=UPI0008201C96|nr:aldehyde dehydrogenase [Vogesella sp. LIG4]SCK24990.1 gamma-glutamyl-gamma-aminobutyraldehyde dehydrogenase [Vogesella sp. LIG4]
MARTHAEWKALSSEIKIEGRAFIDGEYVDAADGRSFDCINPATGDKLASIAWAGEHEVELTVKAARRAFENGGWSDLPPLARGRILKRFAALIREHRDELALLETLDAGKPIGDTTTVDVPGAAYCVEWFAEAIDKVGGEVAPVDPKLVGLVTREAIGVVAAVVPWNFPILMASWKFGPALAAGNALILKPSEKSPLTAIRLAALAKQAGIPDGIFQVLPGAGDVGKRLAMHMDIDCIAFTGSTGVGKLIAADAAQSNLKRVWLELGGKSPNIVLPDCPDLARAARTAAGAIFYNMGEMCTAGSRLLVHEDIKDAFVAEFKKAADGFYPGDPLDPSSGMGAIVDRTQYDKVLSYIDKAKSEGAELVCGGKATHVDTGLFIEPTAFVCQRPDMTICREEIFGPVLSIITFKDVEEAIRIANDTEYGLAAAVWTSNVTTAHQVSRRLRAGTVWVNCYDEGGDMNFPFGGFKQSGNGRDKSLHALEKYTELKSTLIKL